MKTAADSHPKVIKTYYEGSPPSIKTCVYWFRRFRSTDFSVNGKECLGQRKRFEDIQLQELLNTNSAQSTLKFAEILNVD